MRRAHILATAAILALLAWPGSLHAADAGRGRTLYESGCDGCHSVSVHGRDKRAATDFASVRAWVQRWNANLGLKWNEDDVQEVSVYLNSRFYRFACPPSACKATSDSGRSPENVASR